MKNVELELSEHEREMLREAILEPRLAVTGLIVIHAGRRIRLHPNTDADDQRRNDFKQAGEMPLGVCRPGLPWEAIGEADEVDEDGDPVQVEGTGATPLEAIEECTKEAERVEMGERDIDLADEDDINPFRQ